MSISQKEKCVSALTRFLTKSVKGLRVYLSKIADACKVPFKRFLKWFYPHACKRMGAFFV